MEVSIIRPEGSPIPSFEAFFFLFRVMDEETCSSFRKGTFDSSKSLAERDLRFCVRGAPPLVCMHCLNSAMCFHCSMF